MAGGGSILSAAFDTTSSSSVRNSCIMPCIARLISPVGAATPPCSLKASSSLPKIIFGSDSAGPFPCRPSPKRFRAA